MEGEREKVVNTDLFNPQYDDYVTNYLVIVVALTANQINIKGQQGRRWIRRVGGIRGQWAST